ncbi:hypothetical protein RIU76_06425 [Latilactobacillus sakei subsp. sakei]|uniref:hypothetical protein n=1 Tax=Latilactobacillus sakei TaxID=1599 RepID=UPI0028638D05|nr:hypothetical protein [Latilactobacillus sakei]MDR7924360.1 hypothetical protein [Latilactobacillus sakei subsp. sakei]
MAKLIIHLKSGAINTLTEVGDYDIAVSNMEALYRRKKQIFSRWHKKIYLENIGRESTVLIEADNIDFIEVVK